jgi:hypothetical protein
MCLINVFQASEALGPLFGIFHFTFPLTLHEPLSSHEALAYHFYTRYISFLALLFAIPALAIRNCFEQLNPKYLQQVSIFQIDLIYLLLL